MIDAGGLLSKIFFRGTRVRDGSVGRINLVVVYFVTLGFFPLVSLLILNSNISEAHASFLMSYCWQGHIWGDPAAEIVGSFFGRVEFSVAGFGEINKKTVEGVVGCWAATLLACACCATLPGFPPATFFSVSLISLHMMVATAVTIMETACFRALDNGFIVLSATLVSCTSTCQNHPVFAHFWSSVKISEDPTIGFSPNLAQLIQHGP